MRPTIRLGTISGVRVGLHWSIAVIAILVTSTLSNSILPEAAPGYGQGAYFFGGLVMAVLFLSSIVAHEMGHSIIARRNGVAVRDITLFALGGVAALESEPTTPGAAARIALAGPAASVAVSVAALALGFGASGLGASSLLVGGLVWLGIINGGLAVFNMVPALPLDGGRVWQAVLWKRKGDRLRATIAAARLGRWIGWSLMAFGLWQALGGNDGLWTVFIGWFIATSARAESMRAKTQLGEQPRIRLVGSWPPPPGNVPPSAEWPPPPPSPQTGRRVVIDVDGRPVD